MSAAEESLAELRDTLWRSEATSADQAAHRRANRDRPSPEYYIVDVVAEGDIADIIIGFLDEPEQQYRVRVGLLQDGAAKPWTAAGTYLMSFLLTREYLAPHKLIERSDGVMVVDGSELLQPASRRSAEETPD